MDCLGETPLQQEEDKVYMERPNATLGPRLPPRDLLARLPLPACLALPTAAPAATARATASYPDHGPAQQQHNGGGEVIAANLWLGANLTSRIHVDAHDNLLCVAVGLKVVHLYSPFQLDLLALGPPDRLPVESRLRSALFHTPASWPRGLRRTVARVAAGEALFIPAGWAHEVFTVAAPYTAAVSLWCSNPEPKRIQLRPTLLHLASGGRLGSFVAVRQGQGGKRRGVGDGDGDGDEAERGGTVKIAKQKPT